MAVDGTTVVTGAPGADDVAQLAGAAYFFDVRPFQAYCTGKLNSDGCIPIMLVDGLPSLTDPNPVNLKAFLVNAQKPGLMSGYAAAALPFQDGTLCCQPPLRRTAAQQSGGSPGFPCDGSFAFDINAHIQSGIDPFLTLSAQINCQYWCRDQGAPSQSGLTSAFEVFVCP